MNRLAIVLSAATAFAVTTAGLGAAPKSYPRIPTRGVDDGRKTHTAPNLSTALFMSENPDSGAGYAGYYGCSASFCDYQWIVPMSAYGAAVDAAGNSYVASDTYPEGIYVFPPAGSGSTPFPKLVLDDRGYDPYALYVEPNGTVLVGNAYMDPLGNEQSILSTPQILAYKPGSTKPYVKFAIPSGSGQPISITSDAAGNVYVTFLLAGLFKYTTPTSYTQLPLGPGIEPFGIEVDGSGNLALVDHLNSGSGSAVDVFSLPGMQLLRHFVVSLDAGADVNALTLDSTNTYLYAPTYGKCGGWAIATFNYQSGAYLGCFGIVGGGSNQHVWGLAAIPPSMPGGASTRCQFAGAAGRAPFGGCKSGAPATKLAQVGTLPSAVRQAGSERHIRPPSSNTVVYVSDFWVNNVTEYSSSGSQLAQVGASSGIYGPQGLATDAQGNVYVANTQAEDVLVFSPGLVASNVILYPLGPGNLPYLPSDVAVDNATGVVAITNYTTTEEGPGSVMFFAQGATKPCATITNAGWQEMNFAAFDATGTLYIDGRSPAGKTLVGRVRGECSATKITNLTGAKISYPGGIQIVNSTILIDDQGINSGSVVYTYKVPTTTRLGAPLYKTALGGTHNVAGIAADQAGANLWLADTNPYGAPSQYSQNGAGSGTVFESAYPGGGSPVGSFAPPSAQNLIGIAVYPNAQQ